MKYTMEDFEAASKFPGHLIYRNTITSQYLQLDEKFDKIEKKIRDFLQVGEISKFYIVYIPHVLTFSINFDFEFRMQTRPIGLMILTTGGIEEQLRDTIRILYGVDYGS